MLLLKNDAAPGLRALAHAIPPVESQEFSFLFNVHTANAHRPDISFSSFQLVGFFLCIGNTVQLNNNFTFTRCSLLTSITNSLEQRISLYYIESSVFTGSISFKSEGGIKKHSHAAVSCHSGGEAGHHPLADFPQQPRNPYWFVFITITHADSKICNSSEVDVMKNT